MKPVITNNLDFWAHLVTILMKFGTETNDFSKFLVYMGNSLFGQIWCRQSKLSV